MKILYGVVGEGMGHAMRSRVVLSHLTAQGHEIEVMASGRAQKFLAARFADVHQIHGLHIIYEENRVRPGRTVWSNVLQGLAALPEQISAYFKLLEDFSPEVVISDFESWTYFFAKAHSLPILSIDNMQIINRCTHPREVLEGHEAEFQLIKTFVKSKLPFCDDYYITTFFYPPIRKDHTKLFPPILRPEILAAKPTKGDHLLVYQTSEGNETLSQTLAATGVPCRIYGMRRDIKEDVVEGTLTYRPFSEDGFIADLASSRAVIAGGGFTTMGEAVYLKKPLLAVPVGGQFEQTLNGRYLEYLGFGKMARTLSDPRTVHEFLEGVPEHEDRLANYAQDGNRLLLEEVDHFLDKVAAGIT
jgi:uncharacterized protein (TIGR00661 family)